MLKLATLDARIKLLLLAALSSAALFAGSSRTLALLLLLTWLALLAGGVGLGRLWRQARGMLGMIALIFVLQCLFRRDGAALVRIGSVVLLTSAGLHAGALVALRLLAIVSAALLVLTGALRDYLLALSWLRLPDEIVYMLLAALRFVPLLRAEAQAVSFAMQMRGCDIRSAAWPEKLRLYLAMLLPVTAGALHRAGRMSVSMEARAFRSQPRRSHWRSLRFTCRDGVYAAVFLLLLAACFWLR